MTERTVTIRIITAALPDTVRGMCDVDEQGRVIVLLNEKQTEREKAKAFLHEMLHVYYEDLKSSLPVAVIEELRHQELTEVFQRAHL